MATKDTTLIETTPKALQDHMTIAGFEGRLEWAVPDLANVHWPKQAEGWFWPNVITAVMAALVGAMMWCIIPAGSQLWKWLKRMVGRARRAADWPAFAAHEIRQDLLYQCLAQISATTFAEAPGTLSGTTSKANDPFQWRQSHRGTRLDLAVSGQIEHKDTLLSTMLITLERPGGRAVDLPSKWPSHPGLTAERRGDHTVALFYTGPVDPWLDARKGKSEPQNDVATGMAEALGELLAANGLGRTGDHSGDGLARFENAPWTAAPMDLDSPRRAEVQTHALYRPSAGKALRGHLGWWIERFARHLTLTTFFAFCLASLFIFMPYINPNPIPTGLVVLSVGIVLSIIITMLYLMAAIIPPLARRRVRATANEAMALTWSQGAFSLGARQVRLEQPFRVQLTRTQTEQGRWLNVAVHQSGANHPEKRLQFRVPLRAEVAVDALPRLDTHAPIIAAKDFEQWVWPLLQTHAQSHGKALAWTLGAPHRDGAPDTVAESVSAQARR